MCKKSKKKITNQKYEDYWKLTLEYTDFKSSKFNETLALIVDYVDKYDGKITSEIYLKMQNELNRITPKSDMGSIRKAINQFLKLGFINNGMESYHKKTKKFLIEKDYSRKKRIYSEILYDNASFSRSYKNPTNKKELNFLIKTLEYCGSLSKDNLLALMYQDIDDYREGYVDLDTLEVITNEVMLDGSLERKYNQVQYLYNICKNVLSGIYLNSNGFLTLDKDEQIEDYIANRGRDPYKQRLYKYDLYEECKAINNNKIACYFEDISYPVLIASHIKPYRVCSEDEQFDVNNGLLLSKNIDQLFDKGWISFEDDGKVLYSSNLDKKLKDIFDVKPLDKKYLKSKKRLEYLKYHRKYVFDKNKEYSSSFNTY